MDMDLRGKSFANVNLQFADLTESDLSGVNLRGANLRGAYLTGAQFVGADLTGACLDAAYLIATNFRHALTGRHLLRWRDLGLRHDLARGGAPRSRAPRWRPALTLTCR